MGSGVGKRSHNRQLGSPGNPGNPGNPGPPGNPGNAGSPGYPGSDPMMDLGDADLA